MDFPGNGPPPAEAAVLETGTIKSIRPDKFGFVFTPDGQEAMFFPAESPLATALPPGAAVQFHSQTGAKGRRAFCVRPPCHQGTIKTFNPAKFGFVLLPDGQEAIFYSKDVLPGYSFAPGDVAEFDLVARPDGRHAAARVGKAGVPPTKLQAAAPVFAPSLAAPLAPATIPAAPQHVGTVKSFNPARGFGFVVLPTGEEAIVNTAALASAGPLQIGEAVQLDIVATPKGYRGERVSKLTNTHAFRPVYASPAPARPHQQILPYSPTSPHAAAATGAREVGSVKSFNPTHGFGFIYTAAGDEALVRRDQIEGMGDLQATEMVEYDVVVSGRGKRAVNVRRYRPY